MIGNGRRDDISNDLGALAAARNQDGQLAIRGRIRVFPAGQNGRPHRIADRHMCAPVRQAVQPVKSAGDQFGMFGELTVYPAQHGVLLMNDDRHFLATRCRQGRKGRIAAKAGHQQGLRFADQRHCAGNACIDLQSSAWNGPRLAEIGGRGLHLLHPFSGKAFGIFHAALVRDQADLPAALLHLIGKGPGREQMPPSAACCNDDELVSAFNHTGPLCAYLVRAQVPGQGRVSIPCRSWMSRRWKQMAVSSPLAGSRPD